MRFDGDVGGVRAKVLGAMAAVMMLANVDALGAGLLAAYRFNENDNTAGSLAAVAAATVPDPARVRAANARAGAGLGVFGYGGVTGNTHGFGSGSYVSAPSGFYARANVTAGTENTAVANEDYVAFSLEPQPGFVLHVTALSAWVRLQATNSQQATVTVRSSVDGFTQRLASVTVPGGNSYLQLTNLLNGSVFTNLVNPVEFRFYLQDSTDNAADIVRLDDVEFQGSAGNPPPGMQIISVWANDPAARESGDHPGAFTLERWGDTAGTLDVPYTLGGTAINGVDYQLLDGTARFAAGTSALAIPVVPLDDLQPEPVETIILTLTPSTAFVLSGTNSALVHLEDDNDPPLFVLEASAAYALEGTPGMNGAVTISRTLGDTEVPVAVSFTFGGSAILGRDYTASATNTILFAAGVIQQSVTIMPLDNAESNPVRTVDVSLIVGPGYTVGKPAQATVEIYDDETSGQGQVLLEAESFEPGGWVVDPQFADVMGSPYLLAHGKGRPVADATFTVQIPGPGLYRVWVRTKDWTAPLTDHPGAFKVSVGGVELAPVFGTVGQGWIWQDGGVVPIHTRSAEVRLRDLTGFEGRCDAIFLTTDPAAVPPDDLAVLAAWRRELLGLPETPTEAGPFDLVVVGGGISGSAAAIAAARQGLQVALVHDRPFPGGNASQDVRVHTLGRSRGPIVAEINTPDLTIGSPEFIQSDARRMDVLRAETNLHLFTEWRAFAVRTNGSRISSVDARHTRTGDERRFSAPVFIDSTGDGWIGFWAGALHRVGREATSEFGESLAPATPDTLVMGSTLSWNSRDAGIPVTFPAVPWATNVAKDYYATRGDWYWEYGLQQDTIYDAEAIRDHLFRAIYGTWWNVKQRPANASLELDWVGHIAGKRESRRLVGDYVLTEADVRQAPLFADAVVNESREIDLHYTKAGVYDFITYAQFTSIGSYWIPFRCLYSTNIDNLMMAGRCLSASHVGLGSPRVMNTGGQMGVATGTAAALCKKYSTTPRGVYQQHIEELRSLIGLGAFADLPTNTVSVVDNLDPARVQITGTWTSSTSVEGFYGANYLHDGNTGKGAKSVAFRPDVPLKGHYRVYLRWAADANRATNVTVEIRGSGAPVNVVVNQSVKPDGWLLLGSWPFAAGSVGQVILHNQGTTAHVIADAVALAADFPLDPAYEGSAWGDPDGDGFCNYVEWLNGTDPADAGSFLHVDLEGKVPPGELVFLAQAGKSYAVQFRESLQEGAWLNLTAITAEPLTREVRLTDPSPNLNGSRFYRLVAPSH